MRDNPATLPPRPWDGVIRCELHPDDWHKTADDAEECIQSIANLPVPPRSATPEPHEDTAMAEVAARLLGSEWHDHVIETPTQRFIWRHRHERIEAEARAVPPSEPPALDVERLALAIRNVKDADPAQWLESGDEADAIAAEYAALRPPAEDPA